MEGKSFSSRMRFFNVYFPILGSDKMSQVNDYEVENFLSPNCSKFAVESD